MKTARYGFHAVRLLACLGAIVASTAIAKAQYTLNPSSDFLNVYFYDGFSTIYGTDPTPFTLSGTGTRLSSYTWVNGSTTPGAVPSGSFNTGPMTSANASAQVSYQQASLFIGSNSVSQAGVSPVGTSLALNNTGAGVAELRVDWTASYLYSGPNAVQTPNFLLLSISGTVNNYTILAGEENFQVNAGPVSTAAIPIGGDFAAPNLYPYPVGVNPLANWWGFSSPTTSFASNPNANGGPQLINNGDTLSVSGFIDVLVDPGSIQLTIEAVPEPSPASITMIGALIMLAFRRFVFTRNSRRSQQRQSA